MTKKCDKQQGFTIIELMVTVALVAIIAGLAAPSFTKMMRTSRVQTASNSLMTGFNLARAEAIRRGKNVYMMPVADPNVYPPTQSTQWENGWVIFMDGNDDGIIPNPIVAPMIRVGDAMNGVDVVGADTMVVFNSRGQPTSGAGDYVFNAVNCTSGSDKQVTIDLGTVGRSRSTVDNNEDGAEDFCP